MMKGMFQGFLDRPDRPARAVAQALGTDPKALLPVRLVSHDLRLLGVLHRDDKDDWLVLVDHDQD